MFYLLAILRQGSIAAKAHAPGVPTHRTGLAGVALRAEPQRDPGRRDGAWQNHPDDRAVGPYGRGPGQLGPASHRGAHLRHA